MKNRVIMMRLDKASGTWAVMYTNGMVKACATRKDLPYEARRFRSNADEWESDTVKMWKKDYIEAVYRDRAGTVYTIYRDGKTARHEDGKFPFSVGKFIGSHEREKMSGGERWMRSAHHDRL